MNRTNSALRSREDRVTPPPPPPRHTLTPGGESAPATHRRGVVRRGQLLIHVLHNVSLRDSSEANMGGAPAASARTASKAPSRG